MKNPQAAPSYRPPGSLAKSFSSTFATVPIYDQQQADLLAELDRPYVPRPSREIVEMSRDLSVMNSLARSRIRLAKCVAAGDSLGALNAMEVGLTHELALAKTADRRQAIQQLRTQPYSTEGFAS